MRTDDDPVVVAPTRRPALRAARRTSLLAVAGLAVLGLSLTGLQTSVGRFDYWLTGIAAVALLSAAVVQLTRPVWLRAAALRDERRLAVYFDRIVLYDPSGEDQEWWKAEGHLVTVHGRWHPRITVGDGLWELAADEVDAFDLDEIRAACVARGWSWQEGPGAALEAFDSGDEITADRHTMVLREGREGRDLTLRLVLAVALGGATTLAVAVWLLLSGHSVLWWVVGMAVCLAAVPAIVLLTVGVWTRGLRVEVELDTRRFTVRYGRWTTSVARDRVGRVGCDARRLHFFDPLGRERVYYLHHFGLHVPLLTELAARDWPVPLAED